MQPEQQQRIMGYFIEEAKDHLNTIEQGLLNLQSTIDDPEMVNEMFRAAHSVKGGAAMLGLNGIQHVSHRLEDFFKILKDSAVRVDQRMESAFLQMFDALKDLVEQLQTPFGLTDESAQSTLAAVEPVFVELEQQLHAATGGARPDAGGLSTGLSGVLPTGVVNLDALGRAFREEVPAHLREMLALFKQSDIDGGSRQQLQVICDRLHVTGAQYQLSAWCHLVECAKRAIATPANSYRTLAPIIIRDIKQAQDLVLAGRAVDIAPGSQLLELVPLTAAQAPMEPDFGDIFANVDDSADFDLGGFGIIPSLGGAVSADGLILGESELASLGNLPIDESEFDLDTAFSDASASTNDYDGDGPEVGIEELNTLADLFEGEMPDLGATWQEEELLGENREGDAFNSASLIDLDESGDFSDLLFEELTPSPRASQVSSEDDLNDLFGDVLDDEPTSPTDSNVADAFGADFFGRDALAQDSSVQNDLSEFLSMSGSVDASLQAEPDAELDDVFGMLDGDLSVAETALPNSTHIQDVSFESPTAQDPSRDDLGFESLDDTRTSLDDLDDLFNDDLFNGTEIQGGIDDPELFEVSDALPVPLTADAVSTDALPVNEFTAEEFVGGEFTAEDSSITNAAPALGAVLPSGDEAAAGIADPWEDLFEPSREDRWDAATLASLEDARLTEDDVDLAALGLEGDLVEQSDPESASPESNVLDSNVLDPSFSDSADFDFGDFSDATDGLGLELDSVAVEALTDDGLDLSTDDFLGALSFDDDGDAPLNRETFIQGEIPDPWGGADLGGGGGTDLRHPSHWQRF